ncbi:MAG: DUF6242 domain-containing protein [Prevotella sp.]|nr:DUF6242 domain-containing protein [Prevotella sp.]
MKRIIKPFVILFSTIILMASCLNSDNYNITYYADTAITSFSLGTLNRYLTVVSSTGEDSTVTSTITGSNYKFYIDQLKQEIYNPDSLPVGTDAAHVICTVGSKNAGTIIIKNIDSDTLAYYSSTDSIDFTTPREFRVYALDGMAYRKYTVSVNVHQEYADTFMWNEAGMCDMFKGLKGMKAVECGDKMLVFGSDGAGTFVYSSGIEGSPAWTQLAENVSLDAEAYKNIMVYDDKIWTLNGKDIIVSSNGEDWSVHSTLAASVADEDICLLLGAGKRKLYAINSNGVIVSSDDEGLSWHEESVIDNAENIPTQDVSFACLTVHTNENTERMVIAGNRDVDVYTEDSVAMVWNKIEEYDDGTETHSWYLSNEKNSYELPRLTNLQMLKYGDVLLAMGGAGLGTSTALPFTQLYTSGDCGLTWHNYTSYTLPENFDNAGSNVFTFAIDSNNYLWIICGGNGQVWRGRLTQMGWAENQTSFME